MLTRITKILALSIMVTTLQILVVAQKGEDCRTKEDVPTVFGHWRDDQTNREVDITPKGAGDDIVATYSKPHNCPQPDESSKPINAPVDFEGTYTTKSFEGLIHVCRWRTDGKHPKPYTYQTDQIDLRLGMTDDGLKLTGHWKNPDTNKDEDMSLTRLSPPEYAYRKYEVILSVAGAKIYEKPDTESKVSYTPAADTRLVIYYIELDAAGKPAWYQVTDARTSVGSNNYGWIAASQIRCQKKSKPS